ncbi:hypothetical protein DRN98_07160 [Methanosarcinales archaeon]|nr:MAG: hypothetical protein DRN98_07160 [Methanosarcinales archaeon]
MVQKEEHVWADDTFVDYLDKEERKVHEKEVYKKEEIQELTRYGRIFLVDNLVNPKKGDLLLDIGCGSGERIKKYENICSVIGIDISLKECKKAKKNLSNGNVILASMENLPFKDGAIDKIMAVYSMVYSPDKLGTMREVSRVLKENGEFIVYDPNKFSLRTLLRYLLCIKFFISGRKDPKALHHKIVTRQSLSYLQFKKLGSKVNLRVSYWCGHFSYHIALFAINKSILTDIALFILNIVDYKKWGTIPIIKFFSDFLIIKFIKAKRVDKNKNYH